MKIHFGIPNLKKDLPAVITIGSFDGIHSGHIQLFKFLKNKAEIAHGQSIIITFEPHPREILSPDNQSFRVLSTLDEKICCLERHKIDQLIILPFNKEFSQLSFTHFITDIILSKINISAMVLGYDHHFGKDRQGSFEELQKLGIANKFAVYQMQAYEIDQLTVSSQKIRRFLETANVQKATKFLGHPYFIKGEVAEGHKIGNKIGFPTANIIPNHLKKLIPAMGVYAVIVKYEATFYYGMCNIGLRPTLNRDSVTVETHILDFNQHIYNKDLIIYFIEHLRNEEKFNNIEQLKIQLKKDKENSLKILHQLYPDLAGLDFCK